MTTEMHVDIVSAEREIYSGPATMVFAPALLGEVGIASGHTPLLTRLGPGEVRIRRLDGDTDAAFFISGGVLEVQPTIVTILSDTAERAEDLDEAEAVRVKEAAERSLENSDGAIDYARARAELAESMAQLQTIERMRRRVSR
jgi:F-type H+-transporting ATPase subunit epsilon